MRNFRRKVIQSSRCAPRRTVNLPMKPAKPRAGIAAVSCCSSGGGVLSVLLTSTSGGSHHLRDEVAAIEWFQVFQFLACADKARRDAEFVLNRDDDAAFSA